MFDQSHDPNETQPIGEYIHSIKNYYLDEMRTILQIAYGVPMPAEIESLDGIQIRILADSLLFDGFENFQKLLRVGSGIQLDHTATKKGVAPAEIFALVHQIKQARPTKS